jgi:hypothetical protein
MSGEDQSNRIREILKSLPLLGSAGGAIARAYRVRRNALLSWFDPGIVYPVLIDVRMTNWNEYKTHLSRSMRSEYVRSKRLNSDCIYDVVVRPSAGLLTEFLLVWSRFYRMPDEVLRDLLYKNDRGWIIAGVARCGEKTLAVHPVERYGSYLRCHAPWYDKSIHRPRSMGNFMWLSLIEWSIPDINTDFIDLGGGPVAHLPESSYKLRYNPEDLGYRVKVCPYCGYRWLFKTVEEALQCKSCRKSVGIRRYLSRLKRKPLFTSLDKK